MKAGFAILLVSVLSAPSFAEQAQTMTVAGRVIDYQARPVEGAAVVCYDSGHRKPNLLNRTLTTSDGRFSLEVKINDSYTYLVANKPGLALGWKLIDRTYEYIIRLGKPSLFKGTVVDEVGHPVHKARVRICLRSEMMARQEIAPIAPESWFTTGTDSQGQFIFDNVPKGATADFKVTAPGRASMWTFCDFGLDAGERFHAGQSDIRIVLRPEALIRGQVVDKRTGHGVANVPIETIPYNRGWYLPYVLAQTTDPNGRFEFAGLAPNKYLLRVISDKMGSGYITVNVEREQTVHNVRIPLSEAIPFEVIVYDSKKEEPLENARVQVAQKVVGFHHPTFVQMMTTDANGLVRLSVPPGECEVQAFKYGHGLTGRENVQVGPGQILRHAMFLLNNAIILSGEVLDEQGRQLAGASVGPCPIGFGRTVTDANGLFDNSHTLMISTSIPSRQLVLVRHTPTGLGAIKTLQDPNKTGRPQGRIILKPSYTLTGRVTDPAGNNIPAAYIKLVDGRYINPIAEELFTDANSVYRIHSVPLPESNLKYAVWACAEGFGPTIVRHIPFHEDTAKPVHIDPIVLLPADQVISGVVQDSNDQPVAGVLVSVYGPRFSSTVSQPPCGKILTDAQGRFRIEGMCKEPLRIRVTSPPPQEVTGTTWAYGGNENVRVVLGQKLTFGESLIGKPLPELKNLGINLSLANTNDKVILVCFFDMNQRPSRNCLRQLSKRAQELKAKDIVVIAVQSSMIDENTLEQWVKKNNITFRVGIVEDDEEEIRFTWGVKSLPWLILTDWEHIVRTEGFSLSELDEKLRANN